MAVFNGTDANDTLVGTSAADEFRLSKGDDMMSGGDGRDTVTLDYSALTAPGDLNHNIVYASIDYGIQGYFRGNGEYLGTSTSLIEVIDVRLSPVNDVVYINLNASPAFWDIRIDGGAGAGFDVVSLNLAGDGNFVGNAATTMSGNGVTLSGFEQFDLSLGNGNDNLVLGAGADTIEGGSGNDTIDGRAGEDTLEGNWGADRLSGGDGNDRLFADNAYASVDQGTDIDIIDGGAGDDLVSIGAGDSATGGAGNDRLSLFLRDNSAGINLDFTVLAGGGTIANGAGSISGFESYENIYTTEFADVITIGDVPNGGAFLQSGIFAFGGNDTITSGSRSDTLYAGEGNDVVRAGGEADAIVGDAGDDQLYGEAGDDRIFGGTGADYIEGGDGNDRIDAWDDLSIIEDGNDTVRGGAGNDVITAGGGADKLFGEAGDDQLDGGRGIDELNGGEGSDTYIVTEGDTIVDTGTTGTDRVLTDALEFSIAPFAVIENLAGSGFADQVLTGNGGANQIDGGFGADVMIGGAGNDVYIVDNVGDRVEELTGGGTDEVQSSISFFLGSNVENLTLTGGGETDGSGNSLNNVITGGLGSNFLDGGGGADTLDGGFGFDVLYGGAGADQLKGGEGQDVFFYLVTSDSVSGSADTILDFQTGQDQINVSQALAGDVTLSVSGGTTTATIRTVRGPMTITIQGAASLSDFVITQGLVFGTSGNDQLNGTNGPDVLFGDAGVDTMAGGLDDDFYFVDNAGDQVTEAANAGIDGVESTISYTLGGNLEDLVLGGTAAIDGTGNPLDNFMVGNEAANRLEGLGGADTMIGGGGIDTLVGGAGGDLYYIVDNDIIVETSAADGYDEVESAINFTLPQFVDALTLVGEALNGTGNASANLIVGNNLDNRLDGGAGVDELRGGKGNDTYVVDTTADVVVELAGEGTDNVVTLISYTLGAEIEQLTLGGTAAISGTGNALDNLIVGNAGANQLDGAFGNDTLRGGGGNDTYLVDEYDTVVEEAGGGTDTVSSPWTYTLGANVENLVLSGIGVIDGTGNALANTITGNGNDNVLDGGAGTDRLVGGGGNDSYVVEAGDVVVELADQGWDSVRSTVSYVLGDHLENLTLGGSAAINGTGNALANTLEGNDAANILDGRAGADAMTGGKGNDTYYVDSALDSITEYDGEGTDQVFSAVTFFLDGSLDNLTLTGTAAIEAFGNEQANVITGNSGANRLYGFGGLDVLRGGGGNDTYVLEDAGDSVVEAAGEGVDTVESAYSFTLGANVENLTLTGFLEASGTGNALDNVITGNEWNNLLDGAGGADRMVGGWGSDVYRVDNAGDVVVETGSDEDRVESSVSFVLGSGLENLTLTGTGAINGTGNAFDNRITGNAGANRLDGGAGADRLTGGLGNDVYVVDNAGDVVVEAAGAGTDRIESAISLTLGANVEQLTLTGTAALNGAGNALANVLTGNSGNNILNGNAGADTMSGLGGDDQYYVDNAADVIVEGAGGGSDKVLTSVSFVLRTGVQVETVQTTNTAGTTAISLLGNEFGNSLLGNAGANVLNGAGGIDVMSGFAGNDVYYVDNAADQVYELTGNGTDRIFTSVSYALRGGSFVETISTTNTAGTEAINLGGNETVNALLGNAGNNILNGDGGVDTLSGYGGNDQYYVDNALDQVYEGVGGGTDRIFASASYALRAGSEVETISTTNAALATAINLSGNAFAQTIYGNAGANILNGGGGADILSGFAGNDSYYVDNAADQVFETTGGGTDRIFASVDYTLGAAVQVETLSTDNNAGTAGIDLTGNGFANILYGNAGANVLNGGAGADIMSGFSGADTFAFTTALGGSNVDRIGDFAAGVDEIAIDNAVFNGLGLGALAAGAFHTGSAAADADDRIIYNSSTGALFFDADGAGGAAAVQFATLNAGLALSAGDFVVI